VLAWFLKSSGLHKIAPVGQLLCLEVCPWG